MIIDSLVSDLSIAHMLEACCMVGQLLLCFAQLLCCLSICCDLFQGTCLQEAARIEEFFDTARARVEWLASRQEVTERRFMNHGVPWDRSLFKATRQMSLHLGVIYMSRYAWSLSQPTF